MNVLFILIPIALLISFGFLMSFLWAANRGQYDDLDTAQHKALLDDEREKNG